MQVKRKMRGQPPFADFYSGFDETITAITPFKTSMVF